MRIIKFRVWDTITKKFALFNQLCHSFDDKSLVFQQFTGVLGKDNVEIYEGDLVRTWKNSIHMVLGAEKPPPYTKGEIEWWNEGWAVLQENIGATRMSEYLDCDCHPCALEVIGNIFENANLK